MRSLLLMTIFAMAWFWAGSASAADPPAGVAQPDCRLKIKASLDIEMDNTGRITVPVSFNGVPKRMMLDTGAANTLVTASAVKDLGLTTFNSHNGAMVGFGGAIEDQQVVVSEFGFGGMKGKDFALFVRSDDMDSAGLLGPDILQFFDLDFDFANAKLNLIAPDHCPGNVVYWTKGAYGAIPFRLEQNHMSVDVELDGKKINAILDTGAAYNVMSLDMAAKSFDLDKKKLLRVRRYPFQLLTLGEIGVRNPSIELVPDDESALMGHYGNSLHLILGMGILRRLHLYISHKEQMIYITPAAQY